jgi:hypothetical protein
MTFPPAPASAGSGKRGPCGALPPVPEAKTLQGRKATAMPQGGGEAAAMPQGGKCPKPLLNPAPRA